MFLTKAVWVSSYQLGQRLERDVMIFAEGQQYLSHIMFF